MVSFGRLTQAIPVDEDLLVSLLCLPETGAS